VWRTEEHKSIKNQGGTRRSEAGQARTPFGGLGLFDSVSLSGIQRGSLLWRIGHFPSDALLGDTCGMRFSGFGCSHVTALEPVNCLRANKRTQLTALRSRSLLGTLDAVTTLLYRVVVSASLAPLSRTKCVNFSMSVPSLLGFGGYLSGCLNFRGQGTQGQGSRARDMYRHLPGLHVYPSEEARPLQEIW